MPDCPFLAQCAERVEAASSEFEALVGGMTREQAVWRPDPARWSVVECIDHVNRTAELYFRGMGPAIERARARGIEGAAPYRHGTVLGRLVLRVLEPGAGRTFSAPRIFRPARRSFDLPAVSDDFRRVVGTLLGLIEDADGLDLGRVRFANPAIPLLKVNLAEAFEIHSLHIPRHLAQARAVTRSPGYPESASDR